MSLTAHDLTHSAPEPNLAHMPYSAHTAGVPAKERLDFWQDVVSTAFVPLEAVFPGKRFEGKLRATTLGSST